MNSLRISRSLARTGGSVAQLPFAIAAKPSYGSPSSSSLALSPPPLRSHFLSPNLRSGSLGISARHNFHTNVLLSQEQRTAESVKDRPRRREETEASSEESSTKGSSQQESSSGSTTGEGNKDGPEGEQHGEQKEQKKEKPPPPPPPHGDKTPWQVFTETLRTEFKASKEWNESTKQLASSAHQFTENESVKRARAAYTAASGAATSSTASALKSTGKVLGQSAAWTWETPVVKGVRAGVNATGRGIEKATRPVRETEAFKSLKDVVDDGSSSRYGGWVEKEERRKQRELRELNEMKRSGKLGKRVEKIEEDPNAGTNVTLHKDNAWNERWRTFKDSNRVMQSLFEIKTKYNESENPLVSTARSISDRIAGFFAENETAVVIKKFREMDPGFQIEPFLREMREYILPEVLDAYVKGDTETLKLWLSAAQYQVYAALAQQYTTAGLKSDGRILDIRHVDIATARLLDPGEIPVFIMTCRTQEVHVYRNAKTNELAAGMEDRVQLVTYAIGITRIPEDVNNPETRGWRLIELQKSGRDYI
ncbi:MAG: protein translocase subunit [Candelina submexicana]|nr:MAG: protein translocase subunit [Candelina submexicana]